MEDSTSWKNHGFTLLIFGGIVVLSSIFFVLGMLLGRTQGQQMAEQAFKKQATAASAVETADDIKLNYYAETTEDKRDIKLDPPPPAPKVPPATATPPSREEANTNRKAVASPVVAKPRAPEVYLQVGVFRNSKSAYEQQKKVQSKGFKAQIVREAEFHRVLVGPYKESEVKLATSDLHAKGFSDVIRR